VLLTRSISFMPHFRQNKSSSNSSVIYTPPTFPLHLGILPQRHSTESLKTASQSISIKVESEQDSRVRNAQSRCCRVGLGKAPRQPRAWTTSVPAPASAAGTSRRRVNPSQRQPARGNAAR